MNQKKENNYRTGKFLKVENTRLTARLSKSPLKRPKTDFLRTGKQSNHRSPPLSPWSHQILCRQLNKSYEQWRYGRSHKWRTESASGPKRYTRLGLPDFPASFPAVRFSRTHFLPLPLSTTALKCCHWGGLTCMSLERQLPKRRLQQHPSPQRQGLSTTTNDTPCYSYSTDGSVWATRVISKVLVAIFLKEGNGFSILKSVIRNATKMLSI